MGAMLLLKHTLGPSCHFVADNGDTLNCTTGLEMRQKLLRGSGVINLSNVDGQAVTARSLTTGSRPFTSGAGFYCILLLLQLFGFLGDSCCFSLHAGNFGLQLL